MKKLIFIACLVMITSSYAYQIVSMEDYIQQAQEELTEDSLTLQAKLDARLPVKSKASAGKVTKHAIDLDTFSYSIFVIGDDEFSRQWLKEHAQELEEKNALGFITNVEKGARLDELQELTKAPLLPADVDDLLVLFKESHYPLIVCEGVLWQ